MRTSTGKVRELMIDESGEAAAHIVCSNQEIPGPGRYLLAHDPTHPDQILATPLFLSHLTADGFFSAPPVPQNWMPGTTLILQGILGHGYRIPSNVRRLALIAFGNTLSRLLPLTDHTLQRGGEVVIFTSAPLPRLPSVVEVHPLSVIPEAIVWADFLAIDLDPETLPDLRDHLGMAPGERLPCPAQALLRTSMPCGGLADCGVCSVASKRGWKLTCKDGPVFDLDKLDW